MMKIFVVLVLWSLATAPVVVQAEGSKAQTQPSTVKWWVTPLYDVVDRTALGIGPVGTKMQDRQAADWIKATKKLWDNNKTIKHKPKEIQWFVIRHPAPSKAFYDYQWTRRSALLHEADFRKLTSVWKDTAVCVVFDDVKHTQRVYYPHLNPSAWWKPLVAAQKRNPKG